MKRTQSQIRSRYSNNSRQGFTIVELLIVVVVIAILAAITIVAYNGITNQAKASGKAAEVTTIKKKLESYRTLNANQYPSSGAAALTSSDLGSLSSKIVTSNSEWGCGSAQGITKENYCLFSSTSGTSRYALWWWDDKEQVWMYQSLYVDDEPTILTRGSGSEPSAIPN